MEAHMKPVAVIDGANVALQERTHEGKARMESLMKMRSTLEERGYRPIIIVDASLRHDIDDRRQFEHMEDDGVIYQSPAGTQADYFVLRTAEEQNAIVVSNDRFKDYRDQFPWLREPGRRVPFMIVGGDIMLYCPESDEED
jgi:hypothetical protein